MFSLTPGALESECLAEKNMEAVGWSTICMHVRDVSRVTTGHGASGSDGYFFFFKLWREDFYAPTLPSSKNLPSTFSSTFV